MRFGVDMVLMGKLIISWIEKNKRYNQINVVLDRYGNKSVLTFDSICFESYVKALNEYSEKGQVSFRPSESCQGLTLLDSFFLDLSGDKRFSVRLDLGNVRGDCGLIIRSNYTKISLCFNEDQINKIMEKFKSAINAKRALKRAEEEIII